MSDEEEIETIDAGEHEEEAYSGPWLPPGADASDNQTLFGSYLEKHFWIPRRLVGKSDDLITAANDFHYAMINDHDRNEFYHAALQKYVNETSVVLEIGTGSGLLAMIAAKAGAKSVVAVEANKHMCEVANNNIRSNGLEDRITVINKLSTEVTAEEHLAEGKRANVLVSEILGTLLLGESALEYVADTRKRLLTPDAIIVPACGCQYATLIESEDLQSITAVNSWGGFDLSGFNAMQDTVSLVFTKQFGFRFSSIRHKAIAPRIAVAEVDFYVDSPGFLPLEKRIRLQASKDGVVHAIMTSWEVYADRERTLTMSTEPEATKDNFPRDMQWGQGLQLIEDHAKAEAEGGGPVPFRVTAGEVLDLVVRFSQDSVCLQFNLERVATEDS